MSILGFNYSSLLLVSMTLNPTTTTTSELHSTTANKLHCWRNSTIQERAKYNLLITGCGYSATGFFSKALTKAGYPIGHEWPHTEQAAGKVLVIIRLAQLALKVIDFHSNILCCSFVIL
jgi:CRISPR/Cas system endoribonuclease Cas6 (RAMP superfamily)